MIDEIANNLKSEKQEEFKKHYKEHIEKWKKKEVKFCITGASRTGKSSFINAMTGCAKGDTEYAIASVYGNTTREAKRYIHPKHSKFELWDLPGVGTVHFKHENYIENMNLHQYDYFLIFFDVITQQDIWLARKLKYSGKSFCFVRSKLDIDENETQDKCNIIADTICKMALGDLGKEQMGGVDVFVISSTNTKIGHFGLLLNHMENNLDEGQYTAVIYSLSLISEPVIHKKFKILQKRIDRISIVSMFFKDDTDITKNNRSDIILTNLKNEVLLYINTFQLEPPIVEKLKARSSFEMIEVLCKTDEQIKNFIKTSLQSKNVKIFEKGCTFPFSPSQMQSFFRESEILLRYILNHLQNDALYVFRHHETFRERPCSTMQTNQK